MVRSRGSVLFQKYPFEEPLLEPRSYFDEYRKILESQKLAVSKNISENKNAENKFYADFLGLSLKQIEELNETTSISKLDCKDEVEPIEYNLYEGHSAFIMKFGMVKLFKKPDVSLESVKMRNEMKKELQQKCILKYKNYKWISYEEFPSVRCDLNPFNFSTVLFVVKVYHPYLSDNTSPIRMRLLHEIHILGDQFLSELKDTIVCSMDYVGICDISNSVYSKIDTLTLKKREEYLSSFIFIENKFYNDTRSNSLKDLSKTIIDWAASRGIGTFSSGSMENTTMLDLNVCIGHPYVYQHQADCEHVIVISDVRFLNSCDPQKRRNYPRIHARGNIWGKHCMICGEAYARWLVKGNMRLTHDRSYLCSKCFKSYNYVDGQKIGNFQAFEYVDPIALI